MKVLKDFSPQREGSGFQFGDVPLASHLDWRGQAGGGEMERRAQKAVPGAGRPG